MPGPDAPASPEVAREAAIRAGQRYATNFAARYRGWLAAGGPITGIDPHELLDAANECEHGWLAHDRRRWCECFGPARAPKPQPNTPEERPMPKLTKVYADTSLLAKVLADLDREIGRLQAARDALAAVAA
jgi:hypothetical protein